jgi:hypothetical protein
MKKNLIWSTALIILGIFIILLLEADPNTGGFIPGWLANQLSLWQQVGLGCLLGLFFILLRYLSLGIMAIANADLRVVAMLFIYTIPLSLVLIFVQWIGEEYMDNFTATRIPIVSMQQQLGTLRKAGFFKNQEKMSEQELLEMVLGKGILEEQIKGQGLVFYDPESGQIDLSQLLKCDEKKVLTVPNENKDVGTYADFIKNLGRISEGHFQPEKVLETLDSDQNIKLVFKLNHQSKEIILRQDEWENFNEILLEVNALVSPTDFKFYQMEDVILGLSAGEKAQITQSLKLELR